MIEENPKRKNKIKKNIKFILLVIILSLLAWFGVKMLVSDTTGVTTTKSSSLIQTNVGGGGGSPPADMPSDAGGPSF